MVHKKHTGYIKSARNAFIRIADTLSIPLTNTTKKIQTNVHEEEDEQERHKELLAVQEKIVTIETKLLKEEHEKTQLTKMTLLVSLLATFVALFTFATNIFK